MAGLGLLRLLSVAFTDLQNMVGYFVTEQYFSVNLWCALWRCSKTFFI